MSVTITSRPALETNPPSLVSERSPVADSEIPGSPRVDLADLLRHQGRLPARTARSRTSEVRVLENGNARRRRSPKRACGAELEGRGTGTVEPLCSTECRGGGTAGGLSVQRRKRALIRSPAGRGVAEVAFRMGAFADWWPPNCPTGSGAPWWESAEGQRPFARRRPLVGRCLKESLSKRGQRAVCPSPTRGDSKASGVVGGSPQRWSHKADARCVPRFLTGVPPAARGARPP